MKVLEVEGCCSSVVRVLVAKASGPGFKSPATKIFSHFSFAFFQTPLGEKVSIKIKRTYVFMFRTFLSMYAHLVAKGELQSCVQREILMVTPCQLLLDIYFIVLSPYCNLNNFACCHHMTSFEAPLKTQY